MAYTIALICTLCTAAATAQDTTVESNEFATLGHRGPYADMGVKGAFAYMSYKGGAYDSDGFDEIGYNAFGFDRFMVDKQGRHASDPLSGLDQPEFQFLDPEDVTGMDVQEDASAR
ncbi:hypothetical protein SARC_13867 [Sphaeroforma arctica JP610]|uniref:Uncharacterized protein n=1 Tax=Sphaeroforma arctica JP610 TaxID=667725 RepID=A0A0L0FA35_9EUKA|nr:hypothetical protein SARC_13867 [Sphaeroforma arctica JP610]KNC73579.1 hypothetical protein SARC_13867 [Sphaeroforma arctica JP610]|eukprot:XP_014147481.1 hypothetical protein SARC_13867 [Sphaeroforma arctica JP610]